MLEVERVDLHYGAAIALRQVSLTGEVGAVTCLLGPQRRRQDIAAARDRRRASDHARARSRWEGDDITPAADL